MNKRELQEWQEILTHAAHNKGIALWLGAREIAFKDGQPTDGYTRAIRREYRDIMRGLYPEVA